ncbi:MAG: N-acetylneuraminate synthase family protein [Nitrospirales bacterium]
MSVTEIRIGQRCIGLNYPSYFIADIAANHDGNLSRAKDLIHLCAEAGADAAKFQNFQAETIVSEFGFRALGQMAHQASWKKSVFEVYKQASVDLEWTETLKKTCIEAGVEYLTTPYSLELVNRLSPFVCAWKLGSGDITWHELIETLAKEKKPLLIATGASTMAEVEAAVDVARRYHDQIVLMQCNTNYTGSVENFHYVALNVLKVYSRKFPDLVLGLSDHTPGLSATLGAVALGARVIEKHFTDDNLREGPDHIFSMNPKAWREMVDRTRELEAALGREEKRIMDNEKDSVVVQRRAVRAARHLLPGEILTEQDLIPLRPCPEEGLPPFRAIDLVGRRVAKKISIGDLVTFSKLED